MPLNPETTTLAIQVRATFQRFANNAAPTVQPAKTLLQCWQLVFANEQGIGFFESMGIVERSLLRVERQIGLSGHLDAEMQDVAFGIVNGLKILIQPEVFHGLSTNFYSNCNSDRLGALGMLANNLRLDFPEPVVNGDKVVQLCADLDEIIYSIDSVDLDANFKAMLVERAQLLKWMLNNLGLFGAEPTRDALGKILINAEDLPKTEDGQSETRASALRVMIFKFGKHVLSLCSIAKKADDGITVISNLSNDIGKLQDLLKG